MKDKPMPVPIWAGHYIGLPFRGHGRDRSGLDCWGLVRLVLGEQFGHALPSFSTEYERTTDIARISALVTRETRGWKNIAGDQAALGDVIVLRMRGVPVHVGLVLGDHMMLHVEQGIDSAIESYAGARWSCHIHGFYRYKSSFDAFEDA